MNSPVFNAFGAALRDLFSVRVLWIVLWPILVATLMWLVLGIAFWQSFSDWTASFLGWIGLGDWLDALEPVWIAAVINVVLHLLLFVPLVTLTALFITALFAMPALVRLVAERDYPALERRHGGGFFGSVLNALLALGFFIGLWLVSLPLWLIGIGIAVSFLATVYLNQRLFRYDAIAEHADAQEMRTLFATQRAGWWGLGALTSLLQFVPFANLLAPVVAALAFVHFGLGQLQRQRQRARLAPAAAPHDPFA